MPDHVNTTTLFRRALCATALAVLALTLHACGGKEEPVVETEAPVDVAVKSGDAQAPAEQPPSDLPIFSDIPEGAPDTYVPLRFMPAEAQVAVAIPPVPALREKALPILRAMNPDEDIEEALAEAIFDLGDEIGVEAETYEELAAALGVNPNTPVAIFADFTPIIKAAAAAKAAHDATNASATPEGDGDGVDEESTDTTVEADLPDYFEDADEPDIAFVLTVVDPEKLRSYLAKVAEEDEEIAAMAVTMEKVGDVEITVREKYAHFLAGNYLVMGTTALVKGAAARVAEPATIRYGMTECPAMAPDEVAMLVYGNRFVPLIDELVPLMLDEVDTDQTKLIESQIAQYKKMFDQGEKEDPIVGTLSWVENTLELLFRADMETNPGFMETTGRAFPLRLARYLPENTLAMVSLRFNETFKKQIMKEYLPMAAAQGAGDLAMAGQIVPQLGDELTVGIADVVDGLPTVYILLGLAQPEATQGLLQIFMPPADGVEYNGFTISPVSVPAPIPVYLAFVDDFALMGTSEAGLKAIIDHHVAKDTSGLFAAMDPPFDIELPRYQAINIHTGRLGPALLGVAESFGVDTSEASPVVGQITAALREIRMGSELSDGWMKSRLTFYFNDLTALTVETGDAPEATDSDPNADAEAPAL